MYLETRDIDETMKIYNTAWEKGLKSTYYLHMKPRHTAEQSTTNVNKAAKIGKVGFGALNFSNSPAFSAPLQKSLTMDMPAQTFAHTTPETVTRVETIVSETVTVNQPTLTNDPAPATVVTEMVREEMIISTSPVAENIATRSPAPTNKIEEPAYQRVEEEVRVEAVSHSHEQVPVQKTSSSVVGPEDPAEDEGLVCISCQ